MACSVFMKILFMKTTFRLCPAFCVLQQNLDIELFCIILRDACTRRGFIAGLSVRAFHLGLCR